MYKPPCAGALERQGLCSFGLSFMPDTCCKEEVWYILDAQVASESHSTAYGAGECLIPNCDVCERKWICLADFRWSLTSRRIGTSCMPGWCRVWQEPWQLIFSSSNSTRRRVHGHAQEGGNPAAASGISHCESLNNSPSFLVCSSWGENRQHVHLLLIYNVPGSGWGVFHLFLCLRWGNVARIFPVLNAQEFIILS